MKISLIQRQIAFNRVLINDMHRAVALFKNHGKFDYARGRYDNANVYGKLGRKLTVNIKHLVQLQKALKKDLAAAYLEKLLKDHEMDYTDWEVTYE